MKTVRIKDSIVSEIIPPYALPAEKWYGATFAAQCVEAPDEVQERWVYDPATGTFSEPSPEPEPPQGPTMEERLATLESVKADKTEIAAIYEELAAAYTAGVNSI